MRVVSEKPVRTKRVVCERCGYELEYTGSDVREHTGYCMGESDTTYWIKCPRDGCREEMRVSAWDGGRDRRRRG